MKKNDHVIGICSSYTHDGHGVVKIDGFPLFVKGMLINEKAEIIVTMMKKTYGYGRCFKLMEKSKERIHPICPIANQCGGCQLQHMSSKEQAILKLQKVQNVIQRVAHLDIPVNEVLSMNTPFYYRNKGQIPVGVHNGEVACGFYRMNSNDIIDMKSCFIQSERINETLTEIRKLFDIYPIASHIRHLLIKHAFSTDEIMLVLIVHHKDIPQLDSFIKEISSKVPQIKSIILNINKRTDNVILGDKEYVVYGTSSIKDKIHDLNFHISSKSFYQVNPIQTEVLYGKALEFANLNGNETVIDLYCGVGTISMFLAKKAKRVYGIEIVPQAIEDAKANAKLNNLDNIEFICSDAAIFASELSKLNKHIDVVVVDPPRKGCDQTTIDSILKINPERIVYVSCDPATLARDLKLLTNGNYEVKEIQPVDMFPQTFHVETVVLLSK